VRNVLEGLIRDFPQTLNNARREKDLMEVNFAEPVELSPVKNFPLNKSIRIIYRKSLRRNKKMRRKLKQNS